jgi:hypothetical protein
MGNIIERICQRVVVEWSIREEGHRLDVCGLKMGKQLVHVWDVESATGKIGALMIVNDQMRGTREQEETDDFALKGGV